MSNRVIVTNTLITYIQSLLSAVITIFSSRWVLSALGESDFGLYSLNGAIIVFIVFLNSTMTGSLSRYFAYSIGTGSIEETKKWFNVSLNVHTVIPFFLVFIGWFVGDYLINHVFNISDDKIFPSLIIFRISLFAAFWGMLSVPFIALFTANQKFKELSIFRFIQSLLLFSSAYVLSFFADNRLVIYSALMTLSSFVIQLGLMMRASKLFPECKLVFSYWGNKKMLKNLFFYSSWMMFGNLGHLLRTQGMSFLVNVKFGTVGNAALGISNGVSEQAGVFTNSLSNATSPEIVTQVAQGNNAKAILLANYVGKLGIYLILIFAIPLFLEMDNVLKIWLIHPPAGTGALCRSFVIMFVIEKLTIGQNSLLQAIGKISKMQFFLGITNALTLVISLFLIKLGYGIISVGISCILMMAVSRVPILLDVKKYFGIGVLHWFSSVLFPFILVTIIGGLICFSISSYFSETVGRVLLNGIASLCFMSILTFYIVLTKEERKLLISKMKIFKMH